MATVEIYFNSLFSELTLKGEPEVAVETQPWQLSKADDIQANICASKKNITVVEPHFHTTIENEKTQPLQSNKIILGSKPKSVTQDANNKLVLGSKTKTLTNNYKKDLILDSKPNALTQDDRNHIISSKLSHTHDEINKKLILGSKPVTYNDLRKVVSKRTHEDQLKFKHMKLVLQDIKSYLNQNGRYCKLCCRLFLSKNALNVHKKKGHNSKILFKNKHNITKKFNTNKQTQYKCSICGYCFSSSGNLSRHQRNIHQKVIKLRGQDLKTMNSGKANSQNSNSTDLKSKINEMKARRKKQITSKKKVHKCNICDIKFSTYGNFKRHNDKNHNMTNLNLDAIEDDLVTEDNHNVLRSKEKRQFTIAEEHFGSKSARARHKDISIKENSMPIDKFADKKYENKHKAAKKTHRVATDKESLSAGKSSEGASVKEDKKPKYVTRANKNSSKSSNLCLHCKKDFSDQKSLIEHMYEILEPKRNLSGFIKNATNMTNKEDDNIYVCRQCSYYLPSIKSYFTHMTRNHKTESFLEVKKQEFDPQCKYCPYKSSSIAAYNKHINSYHIDLMFLQIKNEIENEKKNERKNNDKFNAIAEFKSFALESVLFECNKCDICFLSSNIARDHNQHNIEMLNNWECSVCHHILKEQDKEMHLKQHSFSQPIKVYNLSETAFSNILYNCTKCAIHFTEKRYQEHYPNCGSDTTDSYYCSICDTLVDRMEMIHHKTQHEDISDFLIVDSSIILNTAGSLKKKDTNVESEVRPRKRLYEQHNCLTYCYTCKSFLSDSGLKNKSHIKKTCSHLHTYPCTVCGLVFTGSTLQIHKKRHEKEKNFRLQDYKFFNLQGIQVIPPIPKYPHCKICKIHFLRKNAISRHICDETDFLTCDICDIKLSEKTYKLHMSFHFYDLRKSSFQDDPRSADQTPEILKEPTKRRASVSKTSAECESISKIKPKISKTSTKAEEELNRILETETPEAEPAEILSNVPDENNETVDQEENSTDLIEEHDIEQVSNDDSLVVLYTCKNCGVTVESYDEVIKHCQAHYSTRENQITSMKKCKLCSLKFDSRSYLDHERNVHSSVSKIQVLKFDPSYFTSKNMIWVKHIFQTLPEEIIKKLLKNSIYQHEHRIQLECTQKGSSPLYVYKCDSCGNFIDPGCVYKHAKNPCYKVRKHPCSLCGLPYISIFSRKSHEKLHKQIKGFTKQSLNIILFNQRKDKTLNERIFRTVNEYLLYQCRNCDRVADKSMLTDHVCDKNTLVKCITCGLLISKEDFKAHLNKHIDLANFCSENFKVILFGRKNSSTMNKDASIKLSSCFSGTVYDYTLYKCQICEMCLKNHENTEKHSCLANFDLDRSTCSECGLNFISGNFRHHIKQHRIDPDFVKDNINVITFNDHLSKTNKLLPFSKNKSTQMKENQYAKISYFDDDKETSNSRNEMCVDDNNKSSEIDDSRNSKYELETEKIDENFVKNDKNNVDYDKCIDSNNEMGVDVGESLDDSKINSNDNDGMEDNVDKELGTLYKCKCGLHFLNKQKVTDHVNKCQPKAKQYKQKCSKCHLLFNPSELFSHLVVHHGDKTRVHNYKVIEITKDAN